MQMKCDENLRPGVDDLDKFGFLGVVGDDGQRLDQVRYGDDQVAL